MNAPNNPNPPAEPAWQRLPHDPLGFFDLSAEDDIRSLKRAYNRLLRRYKPEKFPAEFQRIREAYEQLSEQMRYGVSDSASAAASIRRDHSRSEAEAFALPTNAPADASEHLDGERDLLEQIPQDEESLVQWQARLLNKDRRSPRDDLALAVLSDILPASPSRDADQRSFIDWVLESLDRHRDEPGFCELLREYLAGDLEGEERSRLLIKAAGVLSPNRFYLLTERAWDRLLQQLPFEQFKHTLASCQTTQGLATTDRLVFYVHLLRRAVWKADEDWIEDIRAELEDSYFQLPRWTQHEMECLDALITYQRTRSRFAELSETAKKIDQAIVTFYSAAESEGDWAVLECQYAIAERGLFLAQDFPLEDDLQDIRENLLLVWQTITNEVEDRLGVESLEVQPAELTEPVQQLMVRMQKRASKTTQYSFGNMMLHAGLGVAVVALVAAVSLLIRSVMDFINVGIVAGMIDLVLSVVALFVGVIGGLILILIGGQRVKLQYRDVRLELLHLFRIQPLTVSQMVTVIESTEGTTHDDQSISGTAVVAEGMADDLATNLFSGSLRTLAAAG
ncbi:J domain-containing protein [Roseimaritima sediminicola]|uniref:J domain-containing protein n=1 Tax=Roseimaritima sediminicola TaxID=2662066 RepID=UPI001298498B|nr:J domain-containing protein [Roseimaritima sediminicola]